MLDKLLDHAPEAEQALVDVAGFARPVLDGAAAANVLAASQVDQVELAGLEQLLALNEKGDGGVGLGLGGLKDDGMR